MKIKEFLKNLNYSFYIFVLFLILINCTQKSDSEYLQLQKEIKETYGVRLPDNVKCIFVINDNYCPTCVNIFSQFALDKLHYHKDVLCFINSKGINVDLDAFIEKGNENIHISANLLPLKDKLLPNALGVILLNDAEIDTIVYIQTDKIAEQIHFLDSKINF